MTVRPLRIVQGALLALPNTVLPGIGQIPHMAWAVLAAFSIAVYQPTIRKDDWPYFLFAFGVIANAALGVILTGVFPENLFVNNGFVGGMLLFATYLTARTLNDTVWKVVLIFIAVEAIAIYVQFALGLRFFFPDQQMITSASEFKFVQDVGNESLWYLIRPQGLSTTSTIAGAKMLLGILIAFMVPFPRRWRGLLIAFLLGALLLNFKRSGILSAGIFVGTILTLDVMDRGWKKRHTAALGAAALLVTFALGTILAQMTREATATLGGLSVDVIVSQLSGRVDIWQETWRFITNHFFFGNFSERYTLELGGYAHNSLLTLMATHGMFLAVMMIVFYVKRLSNKPAVLIILAPLLFDSLFQEHIFWYISMIDIFVLYLLTTHEVSPRGLTSRPQYVSVESARRSSAYARI
jgi:hypothetical protein